MYKCLVVDDEPLARDLMVNFLEKTPLVSRIDTCQSALEAGQMLKNNEFDIILLDINMPDLSGTDFAKSLSNPPKIIFTTAYKEYSLDGFEIGAVDYLLKPITFDRFYKAINKTFNLLELEKAASGNFNAGSEEGGEAEDNFLVIKSKHELLRIDIRQILYVESLHKYVKIVTAKEEVTTLMALTAFEKMVADRPFYRCHRSFIVNLTKVDKISGNFAISGTHEVPISKPSKADFIDKLGKLI